MKFHKEEALPFEMGIKILQRYNKASRYPLLFFHFFCFPMLGFLIAISYSHVKKLLPMKELIFFPIIQRYTLSLLQYIFQP